MGDDGKLHFVDRTGADSALNFSSFSIDNIEAGAIGTLRDNYSSINMAFTPTSYDITSTTGVVTSPDGSLQTAWGDLKILKDGYYIWFGEDGVLKEGELTAGTTIKHTPFSDSTGASFALKIKK